ncbi:RdgB/HAM1 family non-canonical purine NTP pyrophosphatase [Geminocystis sp. NIES-3709]|uniref:RdgB/HAM1 family non-canonical purine NTP pyrophosphatase n=1 Tax=Geminocystis sp. NIES-3709 TaxID=1617448 RepID=UPI0005FC6F55|nr:RdgB/HAM1 family non-canonical purine NTP pyrophosphatase [Geminocystis sp. NIES-3709]BAQ66004.1 nucleoside 5-triphosphatase RdgB [Geminocystis sp. NIES-3709]
MKTLVVASSNVGKVKEMQEYLQEFDLELALKPTELEIEETGTTFMENAILKASQVAQELKQWSIADDSGLMVTALNGQPGIYSARYGKTDRERIDRLLTELKDKTNRQAQFVCAIAIANPEGEIVIKTEGICEGEILTEVKGDNGFGYDPIFFIPEVKQTFAQMPPQLKRKLSHRGKAFANLTPLLECLLTSNK